MNASTIPVDMQWVALATFVAICAAGIVYGLRRVGDE